MLEPRSPRFMKQPGVSLLSLVGMLIPGRFTPTIEFARTYSYTCVGRGTLRAKSPRPKNGTEWPPAWVQWCTSRHGVQRHWTSYLRLIAILPCIKKSGRCCKILRLHNIHVKFEKQTLALGVSSNTRKTRHARVDKQHEPENVKTFKLRVRVEPVDLPLCSWPCMNWLLSPHGYGN